MIVNIVYIPEGWILDKIAEKIMEIPDPEYKILKSKLTDYGADINYFVNWKVFSPAQQKSRCDGCWFTHFEVSDFDKKLDQLILGRMDFITAKSTHGKLELLKRGIPEDKIHILTGIGVSPDLHVKKKIIFGISGRPYFTTRRKGEDLLIRLSKDLNNNIFQFMFKGKYWEPIVIKMQENGMEAEIVEDDNLFYLIDYYLQTSRAEGGSMDILNAAFVGIPIISRDIGFFYDLKNSGDIIFKNYDDLLSKLKKIENIKLDRIRKMEKYTWDSFLKYHDHLFKKMLKIIN